MKPVFNFAVLLMSLLIVQASPHSQTQKETRFAQRIPPGAEYWNDDSDPDEEENHESNLIGDSEDESDEKPDDEGITSPSLSCAIFDSDNACNAMCSMIGSIYGHPVDSGICYGVYCHCPISKYATIDNLWKAKFNAKSIPNEIHDDKKLSQKVMKILQKPLRTREQTLQDLQSILTPEQLSKIKVTSTIAKVLKVDGEPDKEALKKYVAKKLASNAKPLNDGLNLFLLDGFFHNPDKNAYPQIIREIRRSDHKALNDCLNDAMRTYKIREPSTDTESRATFIESLDLTIAEDALPSSEYSYRPTWRP